MWMLQWIQRKNLWNRYIQCIIMNWSLESQDFLSYISLLLKILMSALRIHAWMVRYVMTWSMDTNANANLDMSDEIVKLVIKWKVLMNNLIITCISLLSMDKYTIPNFNFEILIFYLQILMIVFQIHAYKEASALTKLTILSVNVNLDIKEKHAATVMLFEFQICY